MEYADRDRPTTPPMTALARAPPQDHAAFPGMRHRRHSFAVRRLLRWHEQGENVHEHMLALSTYMGHAKVSNTYWYLTGTPELLQVVGRRFEHFVDPFEAEEDDDD